MKIDKIIKMKNNKYKIYVDGEAIVTYDNVILKNDLLYKKNIDSNIYKKIISDTNYYDVYDKTVKYILKRRRSEREIKIYLNKFDIDDNEKNEMIKKLKELKLINDIEYCKAYINDKLFLSKDGINKIKNDLLKEDIKLEIIEEELNNVDKEIFSNRLEKLIIKKIKTNKKYSNNYLKQKILNEMINLGYSKDQVLEFIDNNIETNNDVLKNEFDKLYNKYKFKYNGFDLSNILKQKLLQKGFNIGEINNLIQEKTEE